MTPATLPRATKIVATIGTASSTPAELRKLADAGVNVFRLNFSHGTQEEQAARIHAIRALEEDTGRPSCILADLQGPSTASALSRRASFWRLAPALRSTGRRSLAPWRGPVCRIRKYSRR